eukprot:15468645-Alexandrium_andersonii.AAC.1
MPRCIAGGLKGRTAEQVFEPFATLLEAAHNSAMDLENGEGPDLVYVGRSWGYSSAFDGVAPTDVCAVWELFG